MNSVLKDREFRRIWALPRRQLPTNVDLTSEFRVKGGTWSLNDIQSQALDELRNQPAPKGLFGAIPVGEGKGIISVLAPLILQAKRPLLLLPASLRNTYFSDVKPQIEQHFKVPDNLEVRSYAFISMAKNKDFLDTYQPDLIIGDEAHALKNPKSSRTRRIGAYYKKNPSCRFVLLSGSFLKDSLKNISHLLRWTLREQSPVPQTYHSLTAWCGALDPDIAWDLQYAPGPLMDFCEPFETLREGFGRRLRDTPGVIAPKTTKLPCGLNIFRRQKIRVPKDIKDALKNLEETWVTPGGEEINDAPSYWRATMQLSLGYYTVWDPEPPKDWLQARKEWTRIVQHVLRYNKQDLFSAKDVENEYGHTQEFQTWQAIKPTFKPNSKPIWISDYMLKWVDRWLTQHNGIAWVASPHFGEKLKHKYFGAGDQAVENYPLSCAASIQAHGTGRNLQQFSKALVVSPPAAGATWEQLLGRLHRQGQKADTVEFHVAQHTQPLTKAFDSALKDADFLTEVQDQQQKLRIATLGVDP